MQVHAEVMRQVRDESQKRIQSDKTRVSADVRELLEHIEGNLFVDGFNAGKVREKKRPSAETEARFKTELSGLTIAAYIKNQRFLAATNLLQTTSLEVAEIAGLVRAPSAFSDAYRKWDKHGRSPTTVRREAPKPEIALSRIQAIRRYLWYGVERLSDDQSAEMHAVARAQAGFREPDLQFEEEVHVLEEMLEEKGVHVAKEMCRSPSVGSRELFEALCRRSRTAGRLDRIRGLQLAELALALVEGNFERLGHDGPSLLALAWARRGNAKRIAADLDGADADIRRAEAYLEKARKPVEVEAEILFLKGSLRLFQRRFAEALDLLNEAAGLAEALGENMLLVDILHQRAATRGYQGDIDFAVSDLVRAHRLIPEDDTRRRMGSFQHQLMAFVLQDDTVRAREIIPEALSLSIGIGHRASYLQIRWVEGLCFREVGDHEAAESLLAEAREGYIDLNDPAMTAVVSVELALLYYDQSKTADVISHAGEALPAFEALKLPETATAHALLQDAILNRNIQRNILEQARQTLLFAF